MTASSKYATAGLAGVGLISLLLWPFLEPAARVGVLVAAAIALPVQIVAFWTLVRFRGELNGFLAVWLGGTVARMVVIAIAAFVVIRSGMEGSVAMLLALAAFFFGLLLLEPVFFRSEAGTFADANGVGA